MRNARFNVPDLGSTFRVTSLNSLACSVFGAWCPPMRRGGALRHPDRSAPHLGSLFAVGKGHLCQIKFWLIQSRKASIVRSTPLSVVGRASAMICSCVLFL